MARPRRREVLAALLPLIAARAWAQTPAEEALLSERDRADIARARAYIQSLTTASARFVQTDPRGAVSQGLFHLQRPGKARFEYDPPAGLLVVADGVRVVVVNARLKTTQAYMLGQTPLGLLLSKSIRLDRGVAVGKVTRSPGAFSILAWDAAKRAQGRLSLDFTDNPLALAGWTVIDPQGGATRVRLIGLAPAAPLPPGAFAVQAPAARPAVAP
jgi:outer membrane lipoprotein-sorting protein